MTSLKFYFLKEKDSRKSQRGHFEKSSKSGNLFTFLERVKRTKDLEKNKRNEQNEIKIDLAGLNKDNEEKNSIIAEIKYVTEAAIIRIDTAENQFNNIQDRTGKSQLI